MFTYLRPHTSHLTPHTLYHRKRKRRGEEDLSKRKLPDPGMAGGAGKQGRIGTTTKTLLTQHLLKKKVGGRMGAMHGGGACWQRRMLATGAGGGCAGGAGGG